MLTKLWFKNFKNLETTQLDLKKQTVYFIYGENNQGKSNFLDAIMVASTGESVFSDDLDLICFNQIESILGIDFYKKKKKTDAIQSYTQLKKPYIN